MRRRTPRCICTATPGWPHDYQPGCYGHPETQETCAMRTTDLMNEWPRKGFAWQLRKIRNTKRPCGYIVRGTVSRYWYVAADGYVHYRSSAYSGGFVTPKFIVDELSRRVTSGDWQPQTQETHA